jgi:hypothetical protein
MSWVTQCGRAVQGWGASCNEGSEEQPRRQESMANARGVTPYCQGIKELEHDHGNLWRGAIGASEGVEGHPERDNGKTVAM